VILVPNKAETQETHVNNNTTTKYATTRDTTISTTTRCEAKKLLKVCEFKPLSRSHLKGGL